MLLNDSTLLHTHCLIAGVWTHADDEGVIEVRNPASGALLATVPRCGVAETRRAIDAAYGALPAWRALGAHERAHRLRAWFALSSCRRAIVALDQAVTASKAHRDRGSDDDLDEPPCTRVKIRACPDGMPQSPEGSRRDVGGVAHLLIRPPAAVR